MNKKLSLSLNPKVKVLRGKKAAKHVYHEARRLLMKKAMVLNTNFFEKNLKSSQYFTGPNLYP